MSTGTDLTDEDGNPRLQGRKPKNEDILAQGVWIKHPETGVTHLVTHKFQVSRLLMEGGKVVPEPEHTETPVPAPVESEDTLKIKALEKQIALLLAEREANAIDSTRINEPADKPRETAHSGPAGGKSAVHR